jgi:dGTPase
LGDEVLNRLQSRERADFLAFEGNAQGLRTLVRLQSPDNQGGLQLTYATLGAFLKYPRESSIATDTLSTTGQSTKKNGYFQSEKEVVLDIASNLGLVSRGVSPQAWGRHPMAFLMEAADDISYRIIDFEDGYRLGHLTYREISDRILRFFNKRDRRTMCSRLRLIRESKEKVEYLRARAINHLIHQVVEVFLDEEKNILNGSFDSELVSLIPSANMLGAIRKLSRQKVYTARQVVEIEAAGFDVLGGLLTYLVPAVLEGRLGRNSPRKSSAKYFELLPGRAQSKCKMRATNDYERLLVATDFVSGMTDSYAVTLFKMLRGISLPTT